MIFSISKIIADTKLLLIKPKEFWNIKKDEAERHNAFMVYLLPLLSLLALAVFLGEFFKRSDFFFEYPVLRAVREILLFLLQYILGSYLVAQFMKPFGVEVNKQLARQLVVFSMLPLVLVSIVTGLFPFLYVLDVAGLYSFYVFWLGAKALMKFPENKDHSYVLICIVANLFVFSFISVFLSKLLTAYY